MRKITMAGCFPVLSLAAATANAQVASAPADVPVAIRDAVAPTSFFAGVTLEGPGSDIGATVRKLRPNEAVAPTHGQGVVVESVAPDGPAALAGLKPGDIIFFYAYYAVRVAGGDEVKQFARVVHDTPPGQALNVVVVRNGTQVPLTLIPQLGRVGISQQP